MRCTSHGKVCLVIIDSGSCTNTVLEDMVTKLGLKTETHLKPYSIHWLQDEEGMEITKCYLVLFSIGKTYCDEIWCDVMKMDACHLLLRRPWEYDRRVQHDGYLNTYSFTKDGHRIVLRPLHPEELAKRHKPMQDTLMTRSEVISHINKGELILIFVSKKESKEEDHIPLDPRVEKLVRKFDDVIPEDIPLELPPMREIQHQIDLIQEHHYLTKQLIG